jgi:hypothetical protein
MLRKLIMTALMAAPVLGFSGDIAPYEAAMGNAITAFRANRASLWPHAKANNNDPAKIEALKGAWIVSYKVGATNHTDQLVINETSQSETLGTYGTGLYYPNQASDGTYLLCSYDPELWGSLDGDYFCLAKNGVNLDVFTLRFSKDTITAGYFGTGTDTTSTGNSLASKASALSGFRQNLPSGTENAVYDSTSQVLSIQDVQAGNDHYQVELTGSGNYRFNLKSATPLATPASNAPAQYDLTTLTLSVPRVKALGTYYKVTLKNTGNFVFQLDKADEIK